METLPDVWNRLVSEAGSPLVNLLAERTHRLCVREPDRDEVEQFLSGHLEQIQITLHPTTPEPVLTPAPTKVPEPTPEPNPSDLSERKTYKAFTFRGIRYEVSSWPDMIVKFCEIVHRDNSERFDEVLNLRGGKGRTYFSRNPNEVRNPKEISGTDIFVTATGRQSINRIAEKLIAHFGYNENDLSFQWRT